MGVGVPRGESYFIPSKPSQPIAERAGCAAVPASHCCGWRNERRFLSFTGHAKPTSGGSRRFRRHLMRRTHSNPWLGIGFDAWRLAIAASTVIGLRRLKIAQGAANARAGTEWVISEKVEAGGALQAFAMTGGLGTRAASAAGPLPPQGHCEPPSAWRELGRAQRMSSVQRAPTGAR